jgi:hypothetical protein
MYSKKEMVAKYESIYFGGRLCSLTHANTHVIFLSAKI